MLQVCPFVRASVCQLTLINTNVTIGDQKCGKRFDIIISLSWLFIYLFRSWDSTYTLTPLILQRGSRLWRGFPKLTFSVKVNNFLYKIILTRGPFNSAIVRYFPSKFAKWQKRGRKRGKSNAMVTQGLP